jgi:hypothetical protein
LLLFNVAFLLILLVDYVWITVRLRLICDVCLMFFNILVDSVWMTVRLRLICYVCLMFFSILIDCVWIIVRWINLLEGHTPT